MKGSQANFQTTDSLLGTEVINDNGESLGELVEIMVDLENGEIAYAIFDFENLPGDNEKLFAIPWRAVKVLPAEGKIVIKKAREVLSQASEVNIDSLSS